MARFEDFPEPDRVEGAPHPREATTVYGHAAAEAEFLAAFNTGRLHHGWLITGPRGIGKATLAWRLARFLLATPEDDGGMFAPPPPTSLDIPPGNPIARRMAALSESRLFLLRRGLNGAETALSNDIRIDELRKLKTYFTLSAADGGRRVALIDSADEMTTESANALLKLLEEPPAKVTLILISHRPSSLLPTIRSRCRELRMAALPADQMAWALTQAGAEIAPDEVQPLTELAAGSVGEAIRITTLDGLNLYRGIITLFATLPRLDRPKALALADLGAGRGNEARFDLVLSLIDLFLTRLARAGTLGYCPPEAAPNEAALIARLAPDPATARHWAELAQILSLRARRGKSVNLDPAALLMDMVLKIDETAGKLAQR